MVEVGTSGRSRQKCECKLQKSWQKSIFETINSYIKLISQTCEARCEVIDESKDVLELLARDQNCLENMVSSLRGLRWNSIKCTARTSLISKRGGPKGYGSPPPTLGTIIKNGSSILSISLG